MEEGPLLLDLLPLLGYAVAAGMVWALYGITRGIGGLLGTLFKWTSPISFLLETPVNAGFKWLDTELGAIAQKLDQQVAVSFHRVARVIIDTAELFVGISGLLLILALKYSGLNAAIQLLKSEVHIGRVAPAITRTIIEKVTRVEKITVHQAAATATAAAGWVTLPRIGSLERDIAGLRGRAKTIEEELGNAVDLLKANAAKLAAVTGIAAVTAALLRLGLGWIKCRNVGDAGKRICGMNPNLLESLLADTLVIASTVSLVEFARELVPVTEAAIDPIRLFWRVR